MSSVRSIAAVALVALLTPLAVGATVALHLADHHRAHEHVHRADVAAHGHGHEVGTPDHDHELVLTAAAVQLQKPPVLRDGHAAARQLGELPACVAPGMLGAARATAARACRSGPDALHSLCVLRI